jgi:hypothetical protein
MRYGAGFFVLRDNADKGSHSLPISSQTVLVGDLLELPVGATTWVVATSSTVSYTRKAIALEAKSSSATEVLAVELDGNEDVQVQSANASDAAHNGDRMALTDKNTVNNSGTDVTTTTVGFVQRGVVGATGDNQIWGNVLVGNGVVSTVS